jgi:hypothetical protein
MVRLPGNVDVFTFVELQRLVATHYIRHSADDDPVFAASRMALQAETRARYYLEAFHLIAAAILQNLVAAPGSLVFLTHKQLPFTVRLSPVPGLIDIFLY